MRKVLRVGINAERAKKTSDPLGSRELDLEVGKACACSPVKRKPKSVQRAMSMGPLAQESDSNKETAERCASSGRVTQAGRPKTNAPTRFESTITTLIGFAQRTHATSPRHQLRSRQ